MTILDFNSAAPLDQAQAEARKRTTVDAEDIKSRLTASARAFVEWLFSGRAHISRGEARIGDVAGTPGASLSIQLEGANAGLWHDHSTGEGGDLITLYQSYMGLSGARAFPQALAEIAKEFLGDPVQVERSAWQPSVADKIAEKKQKLGTKPRADMQELGAPVATYRYQDLQGNQVASVVRFEPDGTRESKTFRPYYLDARRQWIAGAPTHHRPLYRLPHIVRASAVVLCEGEGKADALAQLGIDATSAMQGAKSPLDKTDWEPLRGKRVIVWPDNDEPGITYATAVAKHLSSIAAEVWVIPPPGDAKPLKWDAFDCIAEGGDPHEWLGRAVDWTQVETPVPASRLKLLSLEEIEALPPPTWLVDGVITAGGLSVLWGRSGTYKSFVALDWALTIATEECLWQGREVKHGLVVYVAAEGAHGLAKRAVGWRHWKGVQHIPSKIRLLPHSIVLNSEDAEQLVLAIKALGDTPVLVVLDTLARTFGSGDENKTADMNGYVNAADRLRTETGAHVLIIHHAGKDEEKGERGNLALRGAADTVINVTREGKSVRLINEAPKGKQKDSEEFPTIHLRVETHLFKHRDEDQTTLVLMADEPVVGDVGEAQESPKLGRPSPVKDAVIAFLAGRSGQSFSAITIKSKLATDQGLDKDSTGKALKTLVDGGQICANDEDPRLYWFPLDTNQNGPEK